MSNFFHKVFLSDVTVQRGPGRDTGLPNPTSTDRKIKNDKIEKRCMTRPVVPYGRDNAAILEYLRAAG